MPCVLNRHHYKEEGIPSQSVYVGRYMLSTIPDHVLNGTALGNPFPPTNGADEDARAASLEEYKKWLWEKLKARDDDVIRAMRLIDEDSYLICSCKPKSCHGDVIESAWWWCLRKGLLHE